MATMKVILENQLGKTVHVAVVRHSRNSLKLVISKTRRPIPSGEVVHYDVGPSRALSLKNVPFEMQLSLLLLDWRGDLMGIADEHGFEKGLLYQRIILLPPSKKSPAGPPDPKSLN